MSRHDHQPQTTYRDLPSPPLMQGIGDANLKITTNSDDAQAYFNQGLRLLHDFWYFESYRAFKEAARLDPSAAMAFWGEFEALNTGGPVNDNAQAALQKASSLADKASEHFPATRIAIHPRGDKNQRDYQHWIGNTRGSHWRGRTGRANNQRAEPQR